MGSTPAASGHAGLGSVGEADVLARIGERLRGTPEAAAARVLIGPGDDAAVLDLGADPRVVLTTDSMVRGLDWRDDWSTPEDVGVKLVVQNHADVIAMGARPVALLIALAADPATPLDWVDRLTASLVARAGADGAALIGGDLSGAAPGSVVLAVTAVGALDGAHPVLRSGARVGDIVAIAGSLGRSAAGLALLQRGDAAASGSDAEDPLVAYHRRPAPPLHLLAPSARDAATSLIDVSDGLGLDAGRIARASGVCLALDAAALAVHEEPLRAVLGEDGARDAVPDGWQVIGAVEPAADSAAGPLGVAVDGDPLTGGWDHFRR